MNATKAITDPEELWEQHSETVEVIRCSSIETESIMTKRDFLKAVTQQAAAISRMQDALDRCRRFVEKVQP